MVKWYHRGLWIPYPRFESWLASPCGKNEPPYLMSESVDAEPPSPSLGVVILAAGQGTRMRSPTPKVLHPLAGRPMVGHVAAVARRLTPSLLVVVVSA